MRIVFMGTPGFSVPTLERLNSDKNVQIVYVVTKPDSKSNRGQNINYSDVKRKAIELNIDVLQPNDIKSDKDVIEKLKASKPDYIIVVAYGQILSREILDIPRVACINGHASLLPRYRGASPIQSAIMNGDEITGTTSMLMNEGLDTGDILEQRNINIDKKETAESLFCKLSVLTADVIESTINNFDKIAPQKQDDTKATKSVIIKKEFGEISFSNESSIQIERKIRAYNPWPSAFFVANGERYKLWDADVVDADVDEKDAVWLTSDVFVDHNKMYAKCKDGLLIINEIQKNGKKRMLARDFINGLKCL